MHQYTPEDLLQYLYGETSAQETRDIEAALAADWTLREKFAVLQASHRHLSSIRMTPRTETVLNILRYAQRAHVPQ